MRRFALTLLAAITCCAQTAIAAPPEAVKAAAVLPVPDSSQLWDALDSLEQRVETLEQAKFTPKSVAKPAASKPYAVITIESLPGCPPCNRWKAKEAKELRAQGWTVVEASLTSSTSAPFFRICIGDKCYSHSGFMSHGALRAIVDRARGKSQPARAAVAVQSARYTTAELRSLIQQARPGGWTGAVYADVSPRSSVKQHLVGPEHGFSWAQVSGLSQEEALILHDLAPQHGNRIFPTRQRTLR